MHKIEELANKLMDLSTQLVTSSSRYVELASMLKDEDAVKHESLRCVLETGNQTVAFNLEFSDLKADAVERIIDEVEKQATDYATRIGILWGEVFNLSSSVKDNLADPPATKQPARRELDPQVFKVEDDAN